MELSIRVFYRLELLPVLCAFVNTTADVFGATDKEQTDLCLAAEETAMHIIESFPPEDANDVFEVICRVQEHGLEYEFKNLGLPVNVEALPTYDVDAPDATLDGLRLFLARKVVDQLEFINLGRDGWRTRIFKTLTCFRPLSITPDGSEAAVERERITASLALPDDAGAIVQLAYLTYRYSYTKEAFYYAERLRAEQKTGAVVSFIAKTQSGLMVGHVARILDPDCPLVAEVGAIMIRPAYRRSAGLLTMLKTAMRYKDAITEQLSFYTSNLVTAHVLSQKLAVIMSFSPMALKVSTHARANYMAIQTEEGRESNLYAIRLLSVPEKFTVYVPSEHEVMARRLFENASLPATVESCGESNLAGHSKWKSTHNSQTHYAVLNCTDVGMDFEKSLRAITYKLTLESVETIALQIPSWKPLPVDLEQVLRRNAYFFCGFVHVTPEKWNMLYTRLCNQYFSFDSVVIYDPVAEELKSYSRRLYEQMLSECACEERT